MHWRGSNSHWAKTTFDSSRYPITGSFYSETYSNSDHLLLTNLEDLEEVNENISLAKEIAAELVSQEDSSGVLDMNDWATITLDMFGIAGLGQDFKTQAKSGHAIEEILLGFDAGEQTTGKHFDPFSYEIVAATFSWTIYLLATNPHIQSRLQPEIRSYISPELWATKGPELANRQETLPLLNAYATKTSAYNSEQFIPDRWIDQTTGKIDEGGAESIYCSLAFLHDRIDVWDRDMPQQN
ncbi:hypothetical protein EYZ11_012914 [Aspergillus tanneri]|uniref:Uncharacterized protein n=1 Tax=Aspergillus tanneri TaxID=1220188 RepID=A0A4S3IZ05_9EURO|nr:hypothetical protein EYZ11_012914 [Aspergillus tanneri]